MAIDKDTSKGRKPLKKRLLRIVGIVFLSLLILTAVGWFYIDSQKDKVANYLMEYLDQTYSGDISFDAVSLDRWSGLGTPSIALENLVVVDTSGTNHLKLQASRLNLEISIKNLLSGLIQIKSLRFRDGALIMDNYTPLTPDEEMGLTPALDSTEMSAPFTNTLLEKNTRLEISDLDIVIRHHVKNKLFKFRVDEITSDIEFSDESIRSRTQMDVFIETLGFNLSKGSFVNGAQARGSLESEFDLPKRQLNISSFPLHLRDEVFETSAHLNFAGAGGFDIQLENSRTQFTSVMAMLTENIRQKFEAVEFEKPLHTQTTLKGRFAYKDNPRVAVQFRTEDNSAVLQGEKRMSEMTFSGMFINRIHTEEVKEKEDVKNFRIEIPQLKGRYRDIELDIADMTLASSPDAENAFFAKISAGGSPESLNNFVTGQHWGFEGGLFEMTATIDGEGLNPGSIIAASQSQFTLENTRIINNDNGVGLPVVGISLSIEANRAILEELRITVTPADDVVLRADIRNFSGLFEEQSRLKAHSGFKIESDNLVWDDFIRLFDIASADKSTKSPERPLQDLLKDIRQKYDPQIDLALNRFSFGPFILRSVKSGLHFEKENLLVLNQTSFDVKGGKMELDGTLNLGYTDRLPLEVSLDGGADVAILNLLLDSEQLDFEGGQFQVNAELSGDLLHPEEILRNSTTSLNIQDFRVTYPSEEVVIPVNELALELNEDQAALKELTLNLGDDDELTLSGNIQNLSALLFEGPGKEVSSELHIQSEKMIWEDYLQFFGSNKYKEGDLTPRNAEEVIEADRKFKAILRDIQVSLNPRITADIKEFRYKDMEGFHDLRTAISFMDKQTLQLEETRFLHNRKTAVNLNAAIDISDSPETHVDLFLKASGNPEELNDVLNNDTFFFRGGAFEVKARIRGEIEALDSLIAHSESDLQIRNTFVEHKPSGAHIPIAALDVGLHNNTARLKSFEVELESGNKIALQGEVGHISDLIFDLPPEASQVYSTVSLQAEKVNFKEFQSLFKIRAKDSTAVAVVEEAETAIRPTIRDVYNKFRPRLGVSVDTFGLNGLEVQNLKTGFHFEDQNRLYLEESSFNFYDGSVRLDAHLDISQPEKTLFAFGFVTDRIDLEKLLEAFDYFDLPALQSADRIGGMVSLDTEIEGELTNEGLMIPQSLKGFISFDLEEAQVAGFEPLIESGGKIFKKERVEDIRFMPIQNTLTLADMRLDVPLMEIQSSAFELFVAGHLGFGEMPTNIWIGFPLNNLKTRDVRNIPDKKGYIASGKKVYVEAKSDEKKGMKYILHLTPKKYYRERDMMDAYRKEIRDERLQIRQYKRTGEPQEY